MISIRPILVMFCGFVLMGCDDETRREPITASPALFTNHDNITISMGIDSKNGITFKQNNQTKYIKPAPGEIWLNLVFAKDDNNLYFVVNKRNGTYMSEFSGIRKLHLAPDLAQIKDADITTVISADQLGLFLPQCFLISLDDVSPSEGRLLLRIAILNSIANKSNNYEYIQKSFVYNEKDQFLTLVKP